MKAVSFLIIFTLIGLIVGYMIYGKINDEYMSPDKMFAQRKGAVGWGIKKFYNLEEKRTGILIAGAIGGIVGLVIGIMPINKKNNSKIKVFIGLIKKR